MDDECEDPHDHDQWAQRFKELTVAAHSKSGSSKDKSAMAAYRQMRMDVAAQTHKLGQVNFNKLVARAAICSAMSGDPLAVASYLDVPLLLPLRWHECGESADGDLQSECWRRCSMPRVLKPDALLEVMVLRGPESEGYPILSCPWSLHLLSFSAQRCGRASLDVKQAQKAAREHLHALLHIDNVVGGSVVSTGLPLYCARQNETAIAASILVDVLATQSVQMILAGRHGQDTLDILGASTDTPGAFAKLWSDVLGKKDKAGVDLEAGLVDG